MALANQTTARKLVGVIFGTQFIYDTAHLMYNPTELEEALSYERACSKNASTFS